MIKDLSNKLGKEKISTDTVTKIINTIFSRLDPSERSRVFNMIDNFIIDLGVRENDIPWLNPKKNNIDGFCHLLDMMRLCYAKIINESEKRFKKKIQ